MLPRLYDELAEWWPLFSAPEDYEEEAGFYHAALVAACEPRTVLELGSGGGNNASHMKRHFELTLVDLSPSMLAVSRALNSECEHLQGDMRSVRLEREFDAVFVHDAIAYMTSEADLARAIETAFVHCKPGGVALLVPDDFVETFEPTTSHGGHDGVGRSLRYLAWTHSPRDGTCRTDFAIVLRADGEPTRVVLDEHVDGVFEREHWLTLCRDAGFEPAIQKVVHSTPEPLGAELILCTKPG